MTKDELIAWAKANGWTEACPACPERSRGERSRGDRFGHLQKTNGASRYRLKLSSIAARYEVKTAHGWVRLRSGYYKNLNITADGKLAGMTH